MDKNEAIKELERLFDAEIGSGLNDRDYSESWIYFLDQSLIIAEEAKKFAAPLAQAEVREQLHNVSKALSLLKLQARYHIESSLGFPDPHGAITDTSPIDAMLAATEAPYKSLNSRRSFQKRLLIEMAQAEWESRGFKASHSNRSKFRNYASTLAEYAGIGPLEDHDMKHGVVDASARPTRLNPSML